MASLMEDLIATLKQEGDLYESLLGLSSKKTSVIVSGDLKELSRITDEEQGTVAKIAALDKKRQTAMKDIANVLNKDVQTLKLTDLVQLLDKRPEEQRQLAEERDWVISFQSFIKKIEARFNWILFLLDFIIYY